MQLLLNSKVKNVVVDHQNQHKLFKQQIKKYQNQHITYVIEITTHKSCLLYIKHKLLKTNYFIKLNIKLVIVYHEIPL